MCQLEWTGADLEDGVCPECLPSVDALLMSVGRSPDPDHRAWATHQVAAVRNATLSTVEDLVDALSRSVEAARAAHRRLLAGE